MGDVTLFIYGSTSVIAFLGFALFAWWWYRMRSATEVFIYITLLFFFLSFERGLLALFRYLVLFDIDKALLIITDEWWPLRTMPELIIIGLILVRMSRRVCRTLRLEKKYSKSDTCEGFEDDE